MVAARPAASSGASTSSLPRRRARTRSAVSNVLPPALAGVLLGGVGGDQLVERRALAGERAKDAAEALDMLAHGSGSGDHDRHARRRDIDALVEDPGRHQRAIGAVSEVGEQRAALLHLGLVSDRLDEEAARDLVAGRVVGGEQQRTLGVVAREQALDEVELGGGAERELELAAVGGPLAAALGRAGGLHDELGPAVYTRHPDAVPVDERAIDRALGVVLDALV